MKILYQTTIPTLTCKNTLQNNTATKKQIENNQKERIKNLETLTMGMAFLSLTLGAYDTVDVLGKEKNRKFPLFMYVITLALIAITALKKFNFNKYNRDC